VVQNVANDPHPLFCCRTILPRPSDRAQLFVVPIETVNHESHHALGRLTAGKSLAHGNGKALLWR
jgi:hypothetical protein